MGVTRAVVRRIGERSLVRAVTGTRSGQGSAEDPAALLTEEGVAILTEESTPITEESPSA